MTKACLSENVVQGRKHRNMKIAPIYTHKAALARSMQRFDFDLNSIKHISIAFANPAREFLSFLLRKLFF